VPHLFDRFARATATTTKPGTGLGLYLAAQLAQTGGLTLDYQPGHPRGATFALGLPAAPVPITTRAGKADIRR
jgi:signal transduction histidine kinase